MKQKNSLFFLSLLFIFSSAIAMEGDGALVVGTPPRSDGTTITTELDFGGESGDSAEYEKIETPTGASANFLELNAEKGFRYLSKLMPTTKKDIAGAQGDGYEFNRTKASYDELTQQTKRGPVASVETVRRAADRTGNALTILAGLHSEIVEHIKNYTAETGNPDSHRHAFNALTESKNISKLHKQQVGADFHKAFSQARNELRDKMSKRLPAHEIEKNTKLLAFSADYSDDEGEE